MSVHGGGWLPHLILFALLLAPAERWLGQIRWVTVGLIAHLAGSYIGEGVLDPRIQHRLAPESLVYARDTAPATS
jgi:hypothetical protein